MGEELALVLVLVLTLILTLTLTLALTLTLTLTLALLTVSYRFPHGCPGSVHSGFKLSDHIVQSSTDVSSYYV